jgi:enhancer of mRNA-decapping protein 3
MCLRGLAKQRANTRNLVTNPASGKSLPEFTINAAEITELVEAVNENAIPPRASIPTPVPASKSVAPPALIPAKPKTFEDPAILSMGKRPQPANQIQFAAAQWNNGTMERTESTRTARPRDDSVVSDMTPVAELVQPMQQLSSSERVKVPGVEAHILQELVADEDISEQPAQKPTRRARRRKGQGKKEEFKEPDVTPAKETATTKKGWRQTPLLEPNPSFQPFSTLKRQKQRGRGVGDENGWATEDATDVQDMGDFDFANNLAKFDKHTVFNQIQAEDSVADEDRLVSHNRLPKAKPGTAGGKNLHYTENVLETPNGNTRTKVDPWKSEAGDSDREERASQRGSGSGRHSRRTERAESKLSLNRKPISRKGSNIINSGPSRTLSVSHSIP